MKKVVVIVLLIIIGIVTSACTTNEKANTNGEESKLTINEKIVAELSKFRETAEYARSSEVERDTLIARLVEHHAAFRELEIQYAKENGDINPYSDNTSVFLISINERINGLTSLVIHYGIEENEALSMDNQFSDSTIDMFETILETGIGPAHNYSQD